MEDHLGRTAPWTLTEQDEFTRIQLTAQLEDRHLVSQYEDGLVFVRIRIEGTRYELGKPDERLGVRS